MKLRTAVWLAGILFLTARADDDAHIFTDTQGRAIVLRIIKADLARDQVTVEREDGRRMTVSISGFCESDQAYVREWFLANELISDRNLKIDCDDMVIEKRKEEVMGTRIYVGSNTTEQYVMGYKRYEKVVYAIGFENKASEPITNARLEYRIYYEQRERGIETEPVQKVYSGNRSLPGLNPRKRIEIHTEAIEIYDDNLPNSSGYSYSSNGTTVSGSMKSAESDIHGIRGRLIVKLASGKEIVREFQHPSSLSDKKYPWTN